MQLKLHTLRIQASHALFPTLSNPEDAPTNPPEENQVQARQAQGVSVVLYHMEDSQVAL